MTLTEPGGSYGYVARDGYKLLCYPPDFLGLPGFINLGAQRPCARTCVMRALMSFIPIICGAC